MSELQRKNDFTELSVCSSDLKMEEEKNSKTVTSVGPLDSSKFSLLLHEKLRGRGGNLIVLTQAEGHGLTGWRYASYLMALLSSPIGQCMTKVLKCRGSLHCVGAMLQQLVHKQLPVHRRVVGSQRPEQCQLFCPPQHLGIEGQLELLIHDRTCFRRKWRREPAWLSDSGKSLLLVVCMDLLSLFPITSAVTCSQGSPSPSQSKACSQTFQGRESLAKDLLPLILQQGQAVTARGF